MHVNACAKWNAFWNTSFSNFLPAIAGVWRGLDLSLFLLSISLGGTLYHRKLSFQLNPPQVMSEAVTYSKLSSNHGWSLTLSCHYGASVSFSEKKLICWCDTELTNHPGKKRQGGKTIKNSVSEHTPVVWNDVNDWTDDSLSILRDLCQEGFQPTLSAFAVSVKECYHLSLGFFGPKQSERGFMLWHK